MIMMEGSLVLVLLAAAFTAQSYAVETFCSHTEDMDQIKRFHITPKDNYADDDGGRSKRATNTFSESFTATVTYDSTFDTGLSSSVAQQIKDNVIPKLLEFFESTLSVRPTPGPLVFDRGCDGQFFVSSHDPPYCVTTCDTTPMCGTAAIPTEHLKVCRQCNGNSVSSFANDCEETGTTGTGVNSSFSLYISAVTTGSCPVSPGSGSTLAFAGACEMEDEYDRPVSGYINFCPNSFTNAQTDDYLLTVAKHELLHALGFSSGLYRWWRDENGDPRSPRNSFGTPTELSTNTSQSVTYTDWSTANGPVSHTVSLLVTPAIVEEGRRHYNCSTLVGVQLEDQGGSGTAGSHWEARISRGELMNGIISDDATFSRLTFALLEDSGWYKVNYTNAQQLVWGRAGGCDLVAGSCRGYIDSQEAKGESISPFCDYAQSPPTLYRCNVRRTAVSNCNLATFNAALPAQYQYFSASTQGGSVAATDYCPYQRGFSDTICTDTSNTESGLDNSLAETFGPGARCVEHGSTLWRAQQGNSFIPQSFPRAGCYNYTCSNGQVTIHILDQSYTCTTAGEEISVSQTSDGVVYTGSIICPSCLEICYDDFVNCPEAAQIYSEFANIAVSDPNSGVTSSSSESPSTSTPVAGPISPSTSISTAGPVLLSTSISMAGPISSPSTSISTAGPISSPLTSISTVGPVLPSSSISTAGPISPSTSISTADPVSPSTSIPAANPVSSSTSIPAANPVSSSTSIPAANPVSSSTSMPMAGPVSPSTAISVDQQQQTVSSSQYKQSTVMSSSSSHGTNQRTATPTPDSMLPEVESSGSGDEDEDFTTTDTPTTDSPTTDSPTTNEPEDRATEGSGVSVIAASLFTILTAVICSVFVI